VAESIGSALGMIAAKANAAQKVLSRSSATNVVKREGRRLARKTKKTASAAATSVRRSKAAKVARRGVRVATASAKRAARRR